VNVQLSFRQELDVPVGRVREFFSDVRNLSRVSPPFPKMEISFDDPRVVEGAEFEIRLRFGVGTYALTSRIDRVEPDGSFTDTFSGGPFLRWHHTHRFLPSGEGAIVLDEVEFEPAWWFAPFAGGVVRLLFLYRRSILPGVVR
jgi:ligand-binding SRPBCC domain-containing protein